MKALLASERPENFFLYQTILTPIISQCDVWTPAHVTPKKEAYDVVLCDFSSKRLMGYLALLGEAKKSSLGKMILVSPYGLDQLQLNASAAHAIDFIMGKPVAVEKLLNYIQTHMYLVRKQEILAQKNQVLSDVIDLNMIKIGVFNLDGTLFYANVKYLEENNQDIDAFDTLSFSKILKCKEAFKTILGNLRTKGVFKMERQEGRRWYRSHFYLLKETHVVHLCQDVTDEKFYIQNLERASVFFENSQEGMIITDKSGCIVSINRAFSMITGYTRTEVLGKTPAILKSGMHEKEFYQNMWDSLVHNGRWQGEIWNRRKNGEVYPEWLSITKIEHENPSELSYMAIFTDISTLKEADKKLHFYANYDQLTGLCNRVQFENLFNHALSATKRRNEKLALLFIDLDHFKEVNDVHGHGVGDVMLKKVAKKLQHALRKSDIIARIGGDEFNVLIEGVEGEADVLEVAEKLNSLARQPIEIEGKVFFMSLSIGIALYPKHGEDAATLSKHADTAMYEIKARGRNGAMVYNSNFTEKVMQRINLSTELKNALAAEEFVLHYQPVVSLETGQILGAEALVRWKHPQRGLVPPLEFIGFAEENHLIVDLGRLVFRKGLEDLLLMLQAFPSSLPFRLALNASSQEFFHPDYAEFLLETLKDFGISPAYVELEITETAVMTNPKSAAEKIALLHQEGLRIVLDDFGTGYSSLHYLKNFPIDKLKIDQSFVKGCLEDPKDMAIVKTIVNMASVFDMEVQAEGIETQEHLGALQGVGCAVGQGYWFAKPMALEAFIAYVKDKA